MKDFEIVSVGLMSGTSLDGLDACCATFQLRDGRWSFSINATDAYTYTDEMKYALGTGAQKMTALEFVTFHSQYGRFLGECAADFVAKHNLHPDIVASHGHTIFHEPKKKIMYQIGDGAAIAAACGIPTVSDFRRLDIMLDGQGAPLVPIGDRLLFADYDYCLNIGGFSNISFERDGRRVAFDISPANYPANHYVRPLGMEFDRDGDIGRSGTVHAELLERLNALAYYHTDGPKSLGREWVEKEIYPLVDSYGLPLCDRLATLYEHAAIQVARVIESQNATQHTKMLVTGGGAYNKYLVERLRALCPCDIEIPSKEIIEYKEALIFAFLGALYMADTPSCLSSVTGARRDNIGGMLFKI